MIPGRNEFMCKDYIFTRDGGTTHLRWHLPQSVTHSSAMILQDLRYTRKYLDTSGSESVLSPTEDEDTGGKAPTSSL